MMQMVIKYSKEIMSKIEKKVKENIILEMAVIVAQLLKIIKFMVKGNYIMIMEF